MNCDITKDFLRRYPETNVKIYLRIVTSKVEKINGFRTKTIH